MPARSTASLIERIRTKQPWMVLCAADKYSLTGSENPLISHFYSFRPRSAEKVFVIPDGCIDILFDCDRHQPSAEVYGTPMKADNVSLKPGNRYFGVRFATGVIPERFRISAEELVQHHFLLEDVLPGSQSLVEQIVTQEYFEHQVSLFDRFFSSLEKRHFSSLTSFVVREIFERNGALQMHELETLTGYSLRSIQREFRADMGITPKAYSRIVRCQSAVYQINHRAKLTFSDLAIDLGFSDQPHFLREFKQLVSATPLSYQRKVRHQSYADRIHYC